MPVINAPEKNGTTSIDLLPYYLFGLYITEISTFFSTYFNTFTDDPNSTTIKTLQVVYGTPRPAFRYLQAQYNGKIVLPMMNFFMGDIQRDLSRETMSIISGNNLLPDKSNAATAKGFFMRAPAHYDLTFSFNLWTNTERERDFIMHKIFQKFHKNELSLIYFPDINIRDSFLLMPLKIEGGFADETEIEGLQENDVRGQVKTSFTLKSHAILPMELYEIDLNRRMRVLENDKPDKLLSKYDLNNPTDLANIKKINKYIEIAKIYSK